MDKEIKPKPPNPFSICLAINDQVEASQVELLLAEDGYDVVPFHNASHLWAAYERYLPRFVIVERRFNEGMSGTDLSRYIRTKYSSPFVYILMVSRLSHVTEIEEALDSGACDYLIKPHNVLEIRARVRVGLRWLEYVDLVAGLNSTDPP